MKKFLGMCGLIVCLIAMGFSLVYTFQNPDMTSTRRFLNYWPAYLIILIGGLFFAFWWYDKDDNKTVL